MTVKIVTDSTCDLPEKVIRDLRIDVIPLYINIGDKGYLDGVDITRKTFYNNLPSYPTHPTTGTPGISKFQEVYEKHSVDSSTKILSIHISRSLSATVEIAERASKEFKSNVVYIRDSKQLSMGTGFQVQKAASMAKEGRSIEEIIEALDDLESRTFVAAGLDTLEFLRRSGRMNRFMVGLGSLLKLKPILTMKDGIPGSKRVRTKSKVFENLIKMLENYHPIEEIALLHANAETEVFEFKSRVEHLLPSKEINSVDITPVIGTHIGPGAFGFAVVKKKIHK